MGNLFSAIFLVKAEVLKKYMCVLYFSLIIILFFPFCAYADNNPVCEVVYVEGKVNLQFSDGSTKKAEVGDGLEEGSIVESGERSIALLAYDGEGKNILQVGENSKIKIASLAPIDVGVRKGEVIAKLKNLAKGETFEISTPVCVAAVRGTEYLVNYMNKNSEVRVYDGAVDVFNLDETGGLGELKVVKKGKKISVDSYRSFKGEQKLGKGDWKPAQNFRKRMKKIKLSQYFRTRESQSRDELFQRVDDQAKQQQVLRLRQRAPIAFKPPVPKPIIRDEKSRDR